MSFTSQTPSQSSESTGYFLPDTLTLLHVPSESPSLSRNKREKESEDKSKVDLYASPYDEFYNNFYTSLSNFSYDKAKEYVDKQQRSFTVKHHSLHAHGQGGTPAAISHANNWLLLMTSMSHFVTAERCYMNLSFLAPKGFLRKDSNLKSSMMMIKTELKKFTDPKLEEQLILRDEIVTLVGIRLELMDFYEKLSLLGTAKNVEIVDLLADIELIVDKYNDEKIKARPITGPIFTSLGWEIEIVTSLLKAQASIQNWEFLPSLISLQDANRQLIEWASFLHQKESAKKSTFYNFPPTLPSLYHWICKLKGTLISKFSLYFYEILSKNSNDAFNIRLYCTKLQTDLYYRLTSFQKKSDALSVCLVFDAREVNFHPNGYQHPARVVSSPQGLESFPAILAIPAKPVSHWPSVVMMISDRLQELTADKFVGFYDPRAQATYFIMRMDNKMYMVAIFESKKSEKDNYILKFMQELAIELKCGRIFSALKAGSK